MTRLPTIAAIATPAGSGGIGIVRISGEKARELLSRVFVPRSKNFRNFKPWVMHRGYILDNSQEPVDDALVVYMPGPATFTGEDVAEIHCHGGPYIVESVLRNLLALGAKQAGRGEFTRRAFLNGRMDLSQAEAVAELIAAPSREAARYSLKRVQGALGGKVRKLRDSVDGLRALARLGLDFPDDEIPALGKEEFAAKTNAIILEINDLLKCARRGKIMQQGVRIVLAGAVNAGKSSLLNAIAGHDRALVSNIPGTTRDFVDVDIDLEGLPAKLADTAGFRAQEATDPVECLGLARARKLMADADLVLLVLDGAALAEDSVLDNEPDETTREILASVSAPVILVWNKCDLKRPRVFPPAWAPELKGCVVSAENGENISELTAIARSALLADTSPADSAIVPNTRQAQALTEARTELEELLQELNQGLVYECCLARLDTAAAQLDEILGLANNQELLDKIFTNFCIGK